MNRDVVIEPKRYKGEPKLPECGILAVNPADVKWLEALASTASMKKHYLFHSRLYSSANFFLAGPAVGAPMAALCLEKLIALGARKIILYGWCGSLVPSLQVGDLLVPNQAISDEGTSKHYINSNTIEVDDIFCSDLESCFIKQSIAYKKGPIWTTDAPYRETREKVAGFAEQAVFGVDMEFAALCAVASYRKVQLAGLMLVSDELWKDPWKPYFGDKKFKNRSRQLVEILSTWLNE